MKRLPFLFLLWAFPICLSAQTTALTLNTSGTVINSNSPINFQTQTLEMAGAPVLTHLNVLQGTNITLTWNGTNLTVAATGIGTGTVSSFTSGNLSPIFTTAVATGTSTPSLTYTLTPVAQNAFLAGPSSGGTGTPSYRAIVASDVPTLNQNTTGSAGSVGTGTYLPFLTSGVPGAATSAQVQAVLGAGVYEPALTFSGSFTVSGTNVGLGSSVGISALSNLTTNGFIFTTGSNGTLSAGSLAGDVTNSGTLATVKGIGGVSLAGLSSGLLYNTTSTGIPSIATPAQVASGLSGATGTLSLLNTTLYLPSQFTANSVTLGWPSQSGTLALTGTTTLSGSITGIATLPGTLVTTIAPSPHLTGIPSIGGTLSYSDTNEALTLSGSVNSYYQVIIQNTNSGSTASSDIVVSNNLSTATTYYGNFGINSSGFTGSGAFNQPNYTYLTATSGDLAVGTTTANGIHFVVNNGATDVMAISSTGTLSISGDATAIKLTDTGTLTASGTLIYQGALTPTGTLVTTTGTQTLTSKIVATVMTVNTTGTIAFNAGGYTETIYNTSASTISTGTITLSTNSVSGQVLRYVTAGAITTVTISGTVDVGSSITTLSANSSVGWEAESTATGTARWVRIQ